MYRVTVFQPDEYEPPVSAPWTVGAVERYIKAMLNYPWVTAVKIEGPDCTFIVRRKIKK